MTIRLTPRYFFSVSMTGGAGTSALLLTEGGGDAAVMLSIRSVFKGDKGDQGEVGERGPQGAPGGTLIERDAAIDISGHRLVLLDAQGRANYASSADLTHAARVVGMTTHAAVAGAPVALQIFGEVTEPSWNWIPDQPVYLGADGHLTQSVPVAPAAKFAVVVGFPISTTTLFINIGIPITLI